MKKIFNPYDRLEEHYCFACSKKNPNGLKLEFYEDGDEIITKWIPKKEYSGFHNVLHGGIQCVLMDEIAAWCVQIRYQTSGVTSKIECTYKKPVFINEREVILRSKITNVKKNIVTVTVKLFNAKGLLCSEGKVQYFTFPLEVAKYKFNYPDYRLFFEVS